jgi:hypothetical protein
MTNTFQPFGSIGSSTASPYKLSASNLGSTAATSYVPSKLSNLFLATTVAAIGFIGADVADITSQTGMPFKKSYSHDAVSKTAWISPEVKNWFKLNNFDLINELNELKRLILQVFGNVSISTSIYHDPDEFWSKTVIQIASNLGEDFEKQIELENSLFEKIWQVESIRVIIPFLIISQT